MGVWIKESKEVKWRWRVTDLCMNELNYLDIDIIHTLHMIWIIILKGGNKWDINGKINIKSIKRKL